MVKCFNFSPNNLFPNSRFNCRYNKTLLYSSSSVLYKTECAFSGTHYRNLFWKCHKFTCIKRNIKSALHKCYSRHVFSKYPGSWNGWQKSHTGRSAIPCHSYIAEKVKLLCVLITSIFYNDDFVFELFEHSSKICKAAFQRLTVVFSLGWWKCGLFTQSDCDVQNNFQSGKQINGCKVTYTLIWHTPTTL